APAEGDEDASDAPAERRLLLDGVVAVRSVTRPRLTHHLASGLAAYLGRPLIGAIGPVPGREEPGRHDVNSATRLAGVATRLQLELSPAALAGLPGRRVLLVDDWTESGWTLTVAARLLREAGAEAVHPFVLGVR
ncbi:phosphoribosyltransferase, partial [Cellulosimicrobium cellulans]|uniref:phosphoribosyltransferase n=1 Tax=Cellulosimicrobium cellulans TaxID=1710 RepID=UPI000B2647E1